MHRFVFSSASHPTATVREQQASHDLRMHEVLAKEPYLYEYRIDMSKRNIRKRKEVDEEEEEDADAISLREKLEGTKGLQKYRQRPQGLAANALAGAGNATLKPEGDGSDTIGGYIKEQAKSSEEAVDLEREKYIREQLDKRLGRGNPQAEAAPEATKADDMYAIPAALRTQKVNQEDVSAWMTGIVEVPLSVAHKLKNVEETEVAKKRLLEAAGGALPEHGDSDEATRKEEELRRITYPFRFGQQTAKEEAWRQSRIQKPQQPREWKKKKRGGA